MVRRSRTASSPGAGSEAPVEVDHGGAAAACIPVGEELEAEATETVGIKLGRDGRHQARRLAFAPGMVEVGAGVFTFAAKNIGTENHEFGVPARRRRGAAQRRGRSRRGRPGCRCAFELERATAS